MCLSLYLLDLNKKGWNLAKEGHYLEAIRIYEEIQKIAEQHLEVTDGLRLEGEECCFD